MYSKILVAYDGSYLAKKALDTAIEMAMPTPEATIHVAHVVKVPDASFIEKAEYQALARSLHDYGRDIIAEAESQLEESLVTYQSFLLDSKSSADALLAHAEAHACDLIVMGSRGLSGIREYLGSVSHAIVHRSDIPVLIVK